MPAFALPSARTHTCHPSSASRANGVPVGSPADVWGIGVSLYRALAGKRPFTEGDHRSAVAAERWPQLIEEPLSLDDSVPAVIAHPILSCLAPDPRDRPTPAELASQLELVLDALPKPSISKLKPRLHS